MRGALLIIAACLALVVAGCGGDSSSTSSSSSSTTNSPSSTSEEEGGGNSSLENGSFAKPQVKVPKGPPPKKLVEREIRKGSGATAKTGDEVTVQYVGVGYESGQEFDSSWSRNEPFPFTLGSNSVIPGWEKGIVGMKVGGRRELIIPPELAYGSAGSPPVIGPNETLIFVVDLLEAK